MTTGRNIQGTVTAFRIPPRATRAPGPQCVPLLHSLSFFLSFSDVSDGPHWTCTKGAKWRGDAPTVGNGARDHLAPGLVESQLHKIRAVSELGHSPRAQSRGEAVNKFSTILPGWGLPGLVSVAFLFHVLTREKWTHDNRGLRQQGQEPGEASGEWGLHRSAHRRDSRECRGVFSRVSGESENLSAYEAWYQEYYGRRPHVQTTTTRV